MRALLVLQSAKEFQKHLLSLLIKRHSIRGAFCFTKEKATIRNWDYHNLYMDFSSMFEGNDHPSDIDMIYLCNDGTLIIGEIKSDRGQFTDGQRKLLAKVLNAHKGDAVGLYITHDKLVQNGDTRVDVSKCPVKEIYTKKEHQWRKTKKPVSVKQVLDYYKERARWKIETIY